MLDAAPLICVAVVAVVLVVGWVLGRRRRDAPRGGDLVGDQLAARQVSGVGRSAADLATDDLDRVRALKRQGRLIEAIRTYRELTGLGLKEAKDAVDSL